VISVPVRIKECSVDLPEFFDLGQHASAQDIALDPPYGDPRLLGACLGTPESASVEFDPDSLMPCFGESDCHCANASTSVQNTVEAFESSDDLRQELPMQRH
jgi:hypothetical protein